MGAHVAAPITPAETGSSLPPPSVSSFYINLTGLGCFAAYLIFAQAYLQQTEIGLIAAIGIAVTALPIVLLEILLRHRGGIGVQTPRLSPLERAKSIILRAYFIPLMFFLYTHFLSALLVPDDPVLRALYTAPFMMNTETLFRIVVLAQMFFMVTDVLFATIGYVFVAKSLNTGIKSTEPTLFGWLVGLICYAPFWDMAILFLGFTVFFDESRTWRIWLEGNNVALIIWGSAVVLAQGFESSATMTFGLRFSNLTWRGLISNGPFRFTKHPQYISKMCNRFLVYVPFFSTAAMGDAAQTCAMFAIFCLVYFLRARTEENHLSRYPEYVAYANWINTHGVFRFVGRVCPFLRYDEGRAKAGRIFLNPASRGAA